MGVMACDRHECENIMCNRSIHGTELYYICDRCYEELELYLTFTFYEHQDDYVEVEKGKVLQVIDEFMNTRPMTMSKEKGRPLDILCDVTSKNWD